MTIVVTGASGFLGRALLRRLRATGAAVIGVSRAPHAGLQQVADYAEAPDGRVLVHLAQDSDRQRVNDLSPAAETACVDTFRALLRRGYERVLYASSATLYGDADTRPHRITDTVGTPDAYARIKRACEIATGGHPGGVVARLANLYGPGMASGNVLGTILAQLVGTSALTVRDDTPVRDFLWIDDAAAAMTAMALGRPTGLFNVGSGTGTSVHALARLALDLTGQMSRAVAAVQSSGRRSHLVLDIDETTAAFDWRPQTDLRAGLARLIGIDTRDHA